MPEQQQYQDRTIKVNRVAKVVKGGGGSALPPSWLSAMARARWALVTEKPKRRGWRSKRA